MTPQEAKQRLTSTEFVQAKRYLVWRWNAFSPERHYLAQIAREVCRSYVAPERRGDVTTEHFLLRFEEQIDRVGSNKSEEESEEERSARIGRSKAVWMGLVGLRKDGTRIGSARRTRKPGK